MATKRCWVFAFCQALQYCFLINSINKAGVLPSPTGVLSLERCKPVVWEKDVHVVNLVI